MLTTALLPQSAPLEPMHAQYVPVLTDIAPLLLIRELPQDEYPTPALPRPFTSHDVDPLMFGPNITGYWGARGPESTAVVYGGALSNEDNSSDNFGYGHQNGSPSAKLTLDASRSSSIYGSASTVQPESTRLIPCIKL